MQLTFKALILPPQKRWRGLKPAKDNHWGQRRCVLLVPFTISQAELKWQKDKTDPLTYVIAAAVVPAPASGDTVFVRGYVCPKHCVPEKHTKVWAVFYLC